MLASIRQARRNEEGFTLIELLMVIVILGTLAAVVVFSVGGINDRGEDAACAAEAKTVQVAEEAYFASKTAGNGTYGDAGQLEAEGFLNAAPNKVTIIVPAGGASYSLAPVTGEGCTTANIDV